MQVTEPAPAARVPKANLGLCTEKEGSKIKDQCYASMDFFYHMSE